MRFTPLASWVLAVSVSAACSARITYNAPEGGVTEDRPRTGEDVRIVGCAMPLQQCGGACVDVSANPDHCGACGNRCPFGTFCAAGSCRNVATCASPRAMCGATCADLSADTANCGSCGNRCAAGQSCRVGTCVGGVMCAPPQTMCERCTDVQSDVNNCGACGLRCASSQVCAGGVCRGGSACPFGRVRCGVECVDTSTDAANCGACNLRCLMGQACVGSRCTTSGVTASPAGSPCTPEGTTCPDPLMCQEVGARGFCTGTCDNGTSASEQAQCGGRGSTCLTQGDGPVGNSFCTRACIPAARSEATGACRAGTVCTGWWYTHSAGPDDPGCFPFCGADSDCAGAAPACNPRTGACGMTGVDMTRLADGSACNPMVTVMPPGEVGMRNIQCRGTCFGVSSTNRTQGLCGSFINLGAPDTVGCPDAPDQIEPRTQMGEDNLGICIFRSCMHNSECGAGLLCIYPESGGTPITTAESLCQYATAAQPMGIP